jgi:hypothetical protein
MFNNAIKFLEDTRNNLIKLNIKTENIDLFEKNLDIISELYNAIDLLKNYKEINNHKIDEIYKLKEENYILKDTISYLRCYINCNCPYKVGD